MKHLPLGLGVVVVLLAALAAGARRTDRFDSVTWERFDLSLVDAWVRLRGEEPSSGEVVLVAIDDATMTQTPEVYERRAGLARLVGNLHDQGAKVVALDFMMNEPERILDAVLAEDVRAWNAEPPPLASSETKDLLGRVDAISMGDAELAAALKRGESILGFHIGNKGVDPASLKLTRGTYGQVAAGEKLPPSSQKALASMAVLNKSAKLLGAMSVSEDDNASMRRMPLVVRSGERHYLPMGVALAARHWGLSRGKLAYVGENGEARLGDHHFRGDEDGHVYLNWRGKNAFTMLSASDILNSDTSDVRGKSVLVGYTHLGADRVRTPFGPMPGMAAHATLMDNLLADDLLQRASPRQEVLWTLAIGAFGLLGFLVPAWRRARLLVVGVAAVGALAGPAWFLSSGNVWMGAVGGLLAVFGSALVGLASAWLIEGRDARTMRRTFANYVSPELMQLMIADPSLVQLQGQRRELSVLFSDIRNFTTYSERLEPLELIQFLNTYLEPMTTSVLRHRGFVDKFIGDAVMALFGAPVPASAHAASACRAALDMYDALETVRPRALELGIELAIGVGVNTGTVAVGNIGSAARVEYTALGDAVNLASRLEGLTKNYGVFCLVGENTAAALPDSFRLRLVDRVRVKGKEQPVAIHELLGEGERVLAQFKAWPEWEAALAAWTIGNFPQAKTHFEAFALDNPTDAVVRVYLQRLDAVPEAPADWDGVFRHRTK